MLKRNKSIIFKRCFAILLCLACLFASFSAFFSSISVNSETTITSVKITFKQGSGVTTVNSSLTLFSDTTAINVETNASGCLVVPETFFNIYDETAAKGELAISLDSGFDSSRILDCETFYFDSTITSSSWAYSFTGWKISVLDDNDEETVEDKIPEQTVFQPGDVITPDILEKYASYNTLTDTYELTLEALWGKCYFIQNAYDTMVYTQNSSGIYELNTTSSSDATGASDSNTGNDPASPKATIDGLYAVLRDDENKTTAHKDYDAYATVVMLTGDLDYYKDNNVSTTYNGYSNYYYYYGYGAETNIETNKNINANTEYVSATYKSLQAKREYNSTDLKWETKHSLSTKDTKYSYYYKGRGNYNYVYGNMRLDNILFKKTRSKTVGGVTTSDIGGVTTSEFQLYHPTNDTGLHYFETTARYNVYTESGTTTYLTSSQAAFSSLRTADHEYIVLNGGQIGNMEFYWSSNITGTDRYWYIGRLACINNYITVGCTTTGESLVETVKCNMTITVTGGKIGYITGSSKGMNAISVGDRTVNIYGDGSTHVSADTGTMADYEYNPYITGVYGGGYTSPLYGDVTINAQYCTNLVNVYGGGKDYSATTYGNVTLNITNCNITEFLYGGGQYANVEAIPSTYTQYSYNKTTGEVTSNANADISNLGLSASVGHGGDVEINISGTTIGKSVYGSGMGQTQTISVLSSEIYSGTSTSYTIGKTETSQGSGIWTYTYDYPSTWNTEPTFPLYDTTTGYVLIGSYKYITWSTASPTAVNFRRYDFYAYLSLATVQNVEINITNGSTITGDVYGGGSIAKVLGNAVVNITDSTVAGTVYGGGDGATEPSSVTVYKTGSGCDWTYEVTAYDSATGTPTSVSCKGTYNKLADLTKLGTFKWSGDTSVLSEGGIDYTKNLLYSPNTTGLGAVYGDTSVTISGDSSVKNVYGGGNQGAVYGDITVTVKATTNGTPEITGILYGGCKAADVGTLKDNGEISGGDITVTISSAELTSVYGGNNTSGTIYGEIKVSVSGGTTITSLYGGGNQAIYTGDSITVEVTGGEISNFFGGGLGSDSDADAGGVSNVYINISQASGSKTEIENLYGGGNIGPAGNVAITVAGGEITYLYGGGNKGDVTGNTSVIITGGTVKGVCGGGFQGSVGGSTSVIVSGGSITYRLYGGGYDGSVTGDTSVTISGGSITVNVYGGGYGTTATVGGDSSVTISGGSITGSVYGGGNAGEVLGNTSVTISQDSGTTTIGGCVYGGGYSAAVGTASTSADIKTASVSITGGTITGSSTGSIYGGGYEGAAYGATSVSITGGSLTYGSIYGGGFDGAVTYSTAVTVGITISGNIYGGGYNGAVGGGATVSVSGGVAYVYGSGYGSTATVTGSTKTTVSGAITNNIYGGGKNGAVGGSTSVTSSGSAAYIYGGGLGSTATVGVNTAVTITGGSVTYDVYGGGEEGAVSGSVTISISGSPSIGGSVYGGGKEANVGSVSLTFSSGSVTGSIYGGGYNGAVTGSVTLSSAGTVSGNIYGGGLNGAVGGSTSVTSSGSAAYIYGGGYGSTATVGVNTAVTITGGSVTYDVYGGGEEGAVTGSATISISGSPSIGGSVYGGGKEANVGSVSLTFSSGSVTDSIYGGGYNGNVTGSTEVTVSGGTIKCSIYGGGFNGDVGTASTSASTSASTTVTITGGTTGTDNTTGLGVYGGGYVGDVYGSTAVSISDNSGSNTTIINGGVYGAGYGADACVTAGTAVTINLTYSFTATEVSSDTNTVTSGETQTTISSASGDSVIKGSVYGGGNLGTTGVGTINTSTNTARFTTAATTSVEVTSGRIEGSVYGGGYGVPTGVTYNIYMGTVFGSTAVEIGGTSSYIYIGGSVYGGGSQSRVYAESSAAAVTISSVNGSTIAIVGSVFGGGESGNSATTNASVPTTVGDSSVTIMGNGESTATTIYFINGGVYGDGNLCLVNGTRTITITNFTWGTRTSGTLKTFYSLQRADTVTLVNTQIVLLGAVDLVAEGDSTKYSINRVTTLNLTDGSTIKLDCIVNYLGKLTSDVESDRAFISNGASTTYALSDAEISEYITAATGGTKYAYGSNGTYSKYTNTVCVANGLSLELLDTNGNYGAVTGLFTLSLLRAVEGEGGGFVYASIADSTGDFVCITLYPDSYSVASDVTNLNFASGTYYTKDGTTYTLATVYSNSVTYYTKDEKTYMTVVDDVGGYSGTSGTYSYYYWYIQGSTINYSQEVTGYIGSDVTEYEDSGTVPRHSSIKYYVLNSVSVDTTNALYTSIVGSSTYTLVQSSDDLSGNQIAIEIKIGTTSLGFVIHDASGWGITTTSGNVYGTAGGSVAASNVLTSISEITSENDSIYFVLYKSKDVDTETSGMELTITINIYEEGSQSGVVGNIVSGGTSELVIKGTVNVVRLVPEQDIYKATGKYYAGIDQDGSISITSGSAFTVQYTTQYIPSAFPSSGSATMTWALSTQAYYYYYNLTYGTYMTLDSSRSCVNISSTLNYGGVGSGSITVQYDTATEKYYYQDGNDKVEFSYSAFEAPAIPEGTKITMIDLTGGSAVYYYYICNADTTYINLDDFMVMGSTTKISELSDYPSYKAAYYSGNSNTQATENLLFIFDFEGATDASGSYQVQLQHLYKGSSASYATDIMDYVETKTENGSTTYSRSIPKATEYTIADSTETGYELSANFAAASYYDLDTAVLNVTITPSSTNINTRLLEYECAIKIELVDSAYSIAQSFPVGMEFEYNGTTYKIAADGTYVIIPLGAVSTASATYEINIINELYSLLAIYGSGSAAYFRITLYSAPDASYYNYIEWGSDNATYTINENLTYALSVTATSAQVLTAGDSLAFTVTATCSETSNSEAVTVTLMKKDDSGVYSTVTDMTELFESGTDYGSVTASSTGTACTWTISDSAEAGTYRLVFSYGSHVEYLNVIVY